VAADPFRADGAGREPCAGGGQTEALAVSGGRAEGAHDAGVRGRGVRARQHEGHQREEGTLHERKQTVADGGYESNRRCVIGQ
jgi:hypothetical protein